jgi:hypothetical protein
MHNNADALMHWCTDALYQLPACDYVQLWLCTGVDGYTVVRLYSCTVIQWGTPPSVLIGAPLPPLNPLTEIRHFQLLQQVLQQHSTPQNPAPPKNQKPKRSPDFQGI